MKLTLVCECEHLTREHLPLTTDTSLQTLSYSYMPPRFGSKKLPMLNSQLVGLAKVAGKMLDFNLALLLIPVTEV